MILGTKAKTLIRNALHLLHFDMIWGHFRDLDSGNNERFRRISLSSQIGLVLNPTLAKSWIRKLTYFFFLLTGLPISWSLMQPSMANLNSPSSRVVKDSTPFRRRILRCKNFGKGESWPSLFLDEVNLYLMKFRHRWILNERTFYSFIILFIWKWILT